PGHLLASRPMLVRAGVEEEPCQREVKLPVCEDACDDNCGASRDRHIEPPSTRYWHGGHSSACCTLNPDHTRCRTKYADPGVCELQYKVARDNNARCRRD